MLTKKESLKAVVLERLTGALIVISVTGFFTCVGFVLAQIGSAMGCH